MLLLAQDGLLALHGFQGGDLECSEWLGWVVVPPKKVAAVHLMYVLIHFWKRVLTEISLSYSEIAMGEASILDIFTTNGGQ